jgi:hypothetical protein
MPTPGLSLVGFMDEPTAIDHLRQFCVPQIQNATDAQLKAEWQAAQTALGLGQPPVKNFGNSQIQPLPAAASNYMANLKSQQWVQELFQAFATHNPQFVMVEIDPLLAFQYTVDTNRSTQHCGAMTTPPTLDELLHICLPAALPNEELQASFLPQSLLIRSRNLNIVARQQGRIGANAIGLIFGPQAPLVNVVRYNNRLYLHNGFHRVFGVRAAGAMHVPCLMRDVPDAATAGLGVPGRFSEPLLTSADPPTVAHFTQGRAHQVQLRTFVRMLHVTWSDHVIAEE